MTTMIISLAVLAWIATWLVIILRLHPKSGKRPQPAVLNGLWLLSLSLHGAILLLPWLESANIALSLIKSLSVVMWFSSFLLFLEHMRRPLEAIGLIVIPFTALCLILDQTIPQATDTLSVSRGLGLHVLLSLLAYSMLGLATMQSLLLATQNHYLHAHRPNGFIRALPPLQDMESLLFQLILAGVVLLTLGLLSGFIYLDGLFGSQVAHKTLLSILAWITFATLLFGHWRYGWRGRIAIRWTISGFILLMLAFWGSKFVLEYLVTPA